jgi:hypothetical protein
VKGFRVGLVALAAVLAIAVAAPTIDASPGRERQKERFGAHPGCHGTANAYSNALANAESDPEARQSLDDLRAVADKKGCDLSGVQPASKPNRGGDNEPEGNPDGDAGPPADVVAAKCDRIDDKLAAAHDKAHGNSAAAFANQADKWSCPN